MRKFWIVFIQEAQKIFRQLSSPAYLVLKSIFQHFFAILLFCLFSFEAIPLALSGQPIFSSKIPNAHCIFSPSLLVLLRFPLYSRFDYC